MPQVHCWVNKPYDSVEKQIAAFWENFPDDYEANGLGVKASLIPHQSACS